MHAFRRLALAPMLVLDGVRRSVGEKLDDVGLTDQAKPVAPQRHRARDANSCPRFHAHLIDTRMHRLPAHGMHVLGECLLGVDQQALARAVTPVLNGRHWNRLGVVSHRRQLPTAAASEFQRA